MSFKSVFGCQNSFLCHTDQGSIPVPPSGAKLEMLKQPQNAPYQNWQAKGRGNFCKSKNIPPEHTAFNYFWTHSNVHGGSKRNSNCVSSVGSRKLQIAEHTMFQFQQQRLGAASSQSGVDGQRGGCCQSLQTEQELRHGSGSAVPSYTEGSRVCWKLQRKWDTEQPWML